jgi:hypothetical protein
MSLSKTFSSRIARTGYFFLWALLHHDRSGGSQPGQNPAQLASMRQKIVV